MADFRIIIDIKNAASGDVDDLSEDILTNHGDDFNAADGNFAVLLYQKVGEQLYGREPGDDLIEG